MQEKAEEEYSDEDWDSKLNMYLLTVKHISIKIDRRIMRVYLRFRS